MAIRQNQYWPGLGQNWQSLGINTVLGYNEPDKSDQANLSVSTAISAWGDLLATGLRVGSPATSDGGRYSWLYPFVQQADAAGLRVDFVAVHYYWAWNPADPTGAANQMYNFLLDIWNNTHRPIWITEWNNGANWTDNNPYPPPTYAQQQACISAMINMLENTPFVERYALYNWVEDVAFLGDQRQHCTQRRRDLFQHRFQPLLPASHAGQRHARHRAISFCHQHLGHLRLLQQRHGRGRAGLHRRTQQPGAGDCPGWREQLRSTPRQHRQRQRLHVRGMGLLERRRDWQRIFDFGNDTSHYLFLTPSSGSSTLRFAINNGSGEQIVERAGALASGSWQHVAITLNGNTAVLYVNGAQVASSTSFSIAPSAFSPIKNYLGKSQFSPTRCSMENSMKWKSPITP